MIVDKIDNILFYKPMVNNLESDISELNTVNEYDSIKDAERLDGDKSHNMLISKGMFYIAFPHDGHKPVSHIK